MKTAFLSKLLGSLIEPPVTHETLTVHYASISDVELQQIDSSKLTAAARPLWKAEVDMRAARRRQELVRK